MLAYEKWREMRRTLVAALANLQRDDFAGHYVGKVPGNELYRDLPFTDRYMRGQGGT